MTDTTILRLALQRGQIGAFPSDDVSLVLIAEQRPTRAPPAAEPVRGRSVVRLTYQ